MADGHNNNRPLVSSCGRQRQSESWSRGMRRPCISSIRLSFVAFIVVFLSIIRVGQCDTPECLSLSMEAAISRADVIISGTVMKVTPDRVRSTGAAKYFEGLIEIKRVFKGDKVLEPLASNTPSQFRHSVVTVKGFGEPAICRSTVVERDTKIFMLRSVKGELTLNSSIVPLTLPNLDYVDAIINNQPFVPPTAKPKLSPCYLHFCPFGATCRVNLTSNQPVCVCEQRCSDLLSPVCGSDKATYINHCLMDRASCLRGKKIKLVSSGQCDPCDGHVCETPKICIVNNIRQPECMCSFVCPSDINLVCGSDGRTYSNHCFLRQQACKSQKEIRVLYPGRCSPDHPCTKIHCGPEEECSVTKSGNAICLCPKDCPRILRRVCGNDSITYDNECELKRTACTEKVFITVKHHGPCGSESACSNKVCHYGAVCVEHGGEPVCRCPQCTEEYKPVCGDNGITYQNDCKRRLENCQREENVKNKHEGVCVESCGNQRCEYYAVCESVNNKPRCVCPTSCVKINAPVCGNDGVTYENECELRVEACRRKKLLTIASIGTCDKCRNISCDNHAKCENGICVCPILCATINEPVCGTDNVTYHNDCEMRKKSCSRGTFISVKSYGRCPWEEDIPSGSGDVCNCNPMGSFSTTCDPTSKQCTCKPGVGGKKCDRCEMGYWGLHKIGEVGNPGCIPCNCNKFGASRDDCDQMTGRCMCKSHVMGLKCDRCLNGKTLGPGGCRDQTPTSCDDLDCRYGAVCREEIDGSPACFCDQKCDADTHPSEIVCGSDGQNFGSLCQLQYFACRLQQDITVSNTGPCKGPPPVAATTVSPVTKSRKTTRHIDGTGGDSYIDDNTSRNISAIVQPGVKNAMHQADCAGSYIENLCLSNKDCCPAHSHCQRGLCYCKDGYIASEDNTQCYETLTKPTEKIDSSINACTNNPCQFGTCILDRQLGYRCACPLGKNGPLCNRDSKFNTPSFNGRSHLEVRRIDKATLDLSIEISFSTLNKDGVILFHAQHKNGSGDFVSLSINDGYVEFRYDLGAGPALLRSRETVEPIRIHHIIARRTKESGILIVDNEKSVSGSSPSTLTSLELGDPLYLGYIPQASREVYDKVGVDLGLVGCIYTLRAGSPVDMRTYKLDYSERLSDIKAGVDITECDKNPCKSMPCQNEGTCIVLDAQNFECHCLSGFKGKTCETLVNPCASQPCQHGGTCVPVSSSDGFFCQCAQTYEGLKCERESMPEVFVPQFTGDSYIEIPLNEKLSTSLSITVWFMATKPDGIILLVTQNPDGRGDFISLMLENSSLIYTFYLGSGIGKIESKKHVRLDRWHKVTISRNGRIGEMSIDGHAPITGEATGPSTALNIDRRHLFLGGFSQKTDVPAVLGLRTGFSGAIQRIIINGRTIAGLVSEAVTMRNISSYNGPPCNVNPCMNGGVCVPMLNLVECRCPTNFMGERCEKRFEQVDKDQPVRFDGTTFFSYPNEISRRVEGQQTNNFTIKFRTSEPDGILLLQRGGDTVMSDYLSVAVNSGQVELSFNLGGQSADKLFIVRSKVQVADGQWHTAVVSRQHKEAFVKVDNEEPVKDTFPAATQQLDTDGLLWVGGRDKLTWELPTMKNFIGCVEYVTVNSHQLHLVKDRISQSSTVVFCT